MNADVLDAAQEKSGAKNDARLAKFLGKFPAAISKCRKERLPIGDSMILAIHEKAGIPVAEIRRLIALGREAV